MKALGPEHSDVAEIMKNIAELYKMIGKKHEAIKLEKKQKEYFRKECLKICNKI